MSLNKEISCVVVGGGGHAKVVIDALARSKAANIFGIIDANPDLKGKELMGIPVIGGDEMLERISKKSVSHFVIAVGAVQDNGPREKLFEKVSTMGLTPLVVIHPSAVCSEWSRIGEGSVVFANATINPFVTIGKNVIVNTGAIIDHDCKIGDHAHIATGARLSGTVVVGKRAHIGSGVTIRNNITIGEGVVVGSGSVVVNDVPDGACVKGVPAK
jgi:sugar O-acyltransferase (sialic acid O-acetyltransferase NeuD family)